MPVRVPRLCAAACQKCPPACQLLVNRQLSLVSQGRTTSRVLRIPFHSPQVPIRPTSPLAEADPETTPPAPSAGEGQPTSSSPCTATDVGRSEPCGPGAVPNSADRPDAVARHMAERGSRVPSPWPLHPNGRVVIPAVAVGSHPRQSQSASSTRVLQAQELEAA